MADHYIELPATGVITTISGLTPVSDGSAAATGTIGEVIESTVAAATSTGVGLTGAWGAVTSVDLTAGSWEVTAVTGFAQNGATLTGHQATGISASSSGAGIGTFDRCQSNAMVTDDDLVAVTPKVLVDISSTTTYYLNSMFNYSAGSPQHYGKLTAVRRR